MKTTEIYTKQIYKFGDGDSEGNAHQKHLLGGKGANLAEMSRIGIPVPPGFTITTEVCKAYNKLGRAEIVNLLQEEITMGLHFIENIMDTEFGSPTNPCLLSVRSGARDSMPGMMDTVLNVGLNDETVIGLALKTGKERFAWDSYRRFVQMYGDVVMKASAHTEQYINPFEEILEELKETRGVENDQELETEDLKLLVKKYKARIRSLTGESFPENPFDQLWNSILAVFDSWHTPRAALYRQLNNIPENWGTAVNVQAMVYGNMGNRSASGVAFTRNAATGEREFNGEYLIDAQGEDVVAGIRTPLQITKAASVRWAEFTHTSEEERKKAYLSLEEYMPNVYKELDATQQLLEEHFKDMQDLEFTIQEGKLWMLQTRNGKRTGTAMIQIGMDMLEEGLIDEKELLLRMTPNKLNELLHPVFDPKVMKKARLITKGLPASPGCAAGRVVFFSEDAVKWQKENISVVLCRSETSADDLKGMSVAQGILTSRGGMTSHAAVVARGMGRCCISGASEIKVDYNRKLFVANSKTYYEGDWISLNGTTGEVLEGKIEVQEPTISENVNKLIQIADNYSVMHVHANADTPQSANVARQFGAVGIGLCRTEHMFFEGNRILTMRKMILAEDEEGRRKALDELLPMQKGDFVDIFKTMAGYPVTIRLLDPPLHEFLPNDAISQQELADALDISIGHVKYKVKALQETNPMLGHRGCRLGNTYPEITQMQTRAIIEAAIHLKSEGVDVSPEIMIPLTGIANEMIMQKHIIEKEINQIFIAMGDSVAYKIGTMIEVPRAALIAEEIAHHVDFFSYGTNDMTQMTFGYSRDDAAKFLPIYLEKHILKEDPFEVLDQVGVGKLLKMSIDDGRIGNPDLVVGICGEHGGEPSSVAFCHRLGMDYVSCSPYRVPIAKLAAAQAAIRS